MATGEERMATTGQTAPHVKARLEKPAEYPDRFPVPDRLVSWENPYPEYDPPYYVSPVVLENDSSRNPAGWADPEELSPADAPQESLCGALRHDALGRALNPAGRSGIAGRGLLGKWGPNYAADPIITRINRRENRVELLAIQRRDNGQWAIPGGMVDRGELVTRTLGRELREETGVILDMSQAGFIYQGYVDDPRNTDHAWMETTARHLHLEPETAERLEPRAGSDARAVRWLPLSGAIIAGLYASHCSLVRKGLELLCREETAGMSDADRRLVRGLLE